MNLSDMEDVDAKRLVDFAAGLIFGLRGSIERVTSKVFCSRRMTSQWRRKTRSGLPAGSSTRAS